MNLTFRANDIQDFWERIEEYKSHHAELQVPRLVELERYYEAENVGIKDADRRKTEDVSDNRIAHPFAEYIVNYIQGYTFGQGVKIKDEEGTEKLKEIADDNDELAHNASIGLDLGIYGRAYELLYRNSNDKTKFVKLDPKQTFVVYDETIENLSVAGVRYFQRSNGDEVTEVYTAEGVYTFVGDDEIKENTFTHYEAHSFGSMPINEYTNGEGRRGDFEKVIDLIDAYDGAQSDLANYSEDLNDAILAILGDVKIGAEATEQMRNARILLARPGKDALGKEGKIEAKYIYKQYDSTGAEAYKERLKSDIHTFTHTPNMEDESFGGTQSGEAMKYKLFNLEQKRINKINAFIKTLRRRWRLVLQLQNQLNESVPIDADELRFVSLANLPVDTKGELKAFTEAGGQLSQQTLIDLFPFGVDPTEEAERLKAEEPKGIGYPDDFVGGEEDDRVSTLQEDDNTN